MFDWFLFLASQFINRLSEAVPLGEQGEEGFAFPDNTKGLQRHLCVCQLSRALGLHHALDGDGKKRLIAELKAHYRHGLKFGKSLSDISPPALAQDDKIVHAGLGGKPWEVLGC